MLLSPSAQRDRLTAEVYLPQESDEPLAQLEHALRLATDAAPLTERIRQASRAGTLVKAAPESLAQAAVAAAVITPAEAQVIEDAVAARRQAIAVDSFSPAEYFGRGSSPATRETADQGVLTV